MTASNSAASLHRPWEKDKDQASSPSFSFFPFSTATSSTYPISAHCTLSQTQSAPATPSGMQHNLSTISPYSPAYLPHLYNRNLPGTSAYRKRSKSPRNAGDLGGLGHLLHQSPPGVQPFSGYYGMGNVPHSPTGFSMGRNCLLGSSGYGSIGGNVDMLSVNGGFMPGSPVLSASSHGNPFSPYHYLSPPYGMAHFGLPPTPTWDAVEDKSSIDEQHIPSSIVEASSSPHSPTKPASTQTITKHVIQNKPSSNGAGANGSSHKERDRDRREANSSGASSTGNGVALGQKSPPKKKRKPPPIQIDSSISNFSGDVGSAPVSQPATPYSAAYGSSQHFSVSSAGPSSAMLSPYAYGMLSPGGSMRFHSMMLPPSPYLTPQNAFGHDHNLTPGIPNKYSYDGNATPLASASGSSGFGSMERTKLKLLSGEESPARCEWQPAELFRTDNLKADFRSILRLVNYVKMEDDNTVELNLRPTDLPDTASADLSYSIRALCTRYHPFYEYSRGWVSLEPSATRSIYGLDCVIMQPSDVIMVSPPIGERTDVYGRNIWNGVDLTVNSVFATYCARNRRAVSLESVNEAHGWHLGYQNLPSPMAPREVKVKAKKEKKEKKEKDDKAKRPMNAFMIFAQKYRVFYTGKFPGRDNRAISCLLGEHWKHLEPSEKQEYTEQAKVLAETYKEKNPDCWKRRSRSHSDSDFPIKREDDNHDAVITSAGSTGGSAGGSGSGSSQYELEYSALHSESDNEDVGPILPHQAKQEYR